MLCIEKVSPAEINASNKAHLKNKITKFTFHYSAVFSFVFLKVYSYLKRVILKLHLFWLGINKNCFENIPVK